MICMSPAASPFPSTSLFRSRDQLDGDFVNARIAREHPGRKLWQLPVVVRREVRANPPDVLFYDVEEHIRGIRTNLPAHYYRELPKLATGVLAGYPRVYEIAIELIARSEE